MTQGTPIRKERNRRFLYSTQLVCAFLGVLASLYMLVHHTRVENGIQEGRSFCTLGKYVDCDVVAASSASELMGVPLASIGAGFFFVLLLLGAMTPPKDPGFVFFQRVQAWLTGLALVMDLRLLWVQFHIIQSLCLVCAFTYLVTGVHFWASVSFLPSDSRNWKLRARHLFIGKGKESWKFPKLPIGRVLLCLLSLICFLVMLVLVPSYIRSKAAQYTHTDSAVEQFYSAWKDLPTKDIKINDGDGVYGNPNSKIKIAVFSDFQCPFCKRAAFTMHGAMKALQDRAYFVFKNYPLDSTCNPLLTYQMHPMACRLARLSYCAAKKDMFWQFHDRVFMEIGEDTFQSGFDSVTEKLSGILSEAEINQCLKDPKSLQNIEDSLKLGTTLGLRGTPTVYVNGKHVSIPVSLETLKRIVVLEESKS